jgi:hypothetical protein
MNFLHTASTTPERPNMKNHESFDNQGPEEGPDPIPETHQNLKNQPDNELLPHGETLPLARDPWKELRDLELVSIQLREESRMLELRTQDFILAKLGFVPENKEFWTVLEWKDGTWCVQPDAGVHSSYSPVDHQLADPDGTRIHRVPELGIAWVKVSTCNLWIFRLDKETDPVQGPLPEVYSTGKPRTK